MTQSEIDYVEEMEGRFAVYEFKWTPRRRAKLSAPFNAAYPDSTFMVITPDTVNEFLLDARTRKKHGQARTDEKDGKMHFPKNSERSATQSA